MSTPGQAGRRFASQAERRDQLEQLLLHSPVGYTQAELVARLQTSKATIHRDIQYLSMHLPVLEEGRRYRIDPAGYLHNVRLSMHELEALHLSARLFARVMKFPFPHASAALRKLADAQSRVSQALADQILQTAEDIDGFTSPIDYSRYRSVIEQLGRAMSESRPVLVSHYSARKQTEQRFTLFPITLEPHHEGRAVHLLAWDISTASEQFRTIKIERITRLELQPSAPQIASRIPRERLQQRLQHAWGIWSSDDPPQQVRLQFSAAVAQRVRETHWHHSMTLTDHPDGSLECRMQIAEPREMYPWIRGWGPDVQILEPEWLQQQHKEDIRAMARMYGEAE
ncbi:helix-turn-helix transcriptional regulator [Spirochaeta africana]|uniref:Putative transcriptional regulator n=1 Tax=Spirochaeta africana (strain ATCC 700263 / DSM 8902 / Z-7692) TaxID=889378 RepID=H9UG64_SPIAZ|nr:WYL domain-containing protein [Spirochaeta africana]AFG36507.1 putative transcriptional regulator [Spirochaeta africana DSM 8902]